MAFHDIRLPEDVEQGATGGPSFQTTIIAQSNGAEQRNIDWQEMRHVWELSYGVSTEADFALTRAFFYARRGQANSFRFKDWSDFELIAEPQGLGDGANRTFQLIKTYEIDGPDPYIRRITRPVAGTVVWKVNGAAVGAADQGLGVWLLTTAPALNAIVTADCEFDIPVRFTVDAYALELDNENAGSLGSLPVTEVRE